MKCKGLQAKVVQRAAENNFKSVLFVIINCSETASLAREVFKTKIATECRNYAKQRNSLNTTDPALVAEFLYLLFCYSIQRANNYNVTIFSAVHQLEDSRI